MGITIKKRYVVKLNLEERDQLDGTSIGNEKLPTVDNRRGLSGLIDRKVAARARFSRRTVEQIRECCLAEGLSSALERQKRGRNRSRKLDGGGKPPGQPSCSQAPVA